MEPRAESIRHNGLLHVADFLLHGCYRHLLLVRGVANAERSPLVWGVGDPRRSSVRTARATALRF